MRTRTRLLLIPAVAAVVALSGCGTTAPGPASPAGSEQPGGTDPVSDPGGDGGPVAVTSAPPEPLVDLDCGDLGRVLDSTRYAGLSPREGTVVADAWDAFPIPLEDIVRNAGGVACEWSQGGTWYVKSGNSFELDASWYGAAVFVIPGGRAAKDAVYLDRSCGDDSWKSHGTTCADGKIVGDAFVHDVVGTHDRYDTIGAVGRATEAAVSAARVAAGPIARPAGTFAPPRACLELVPRDVAEDVVGEKLDYADVTSTTQDAATATFYTEHIGCWYNGRTSKTFFEVRVYPGGGWMAEDRLASWDGEAVEVDGMRDGDRAIEHCFRWPDGDKETWCTLGLLVDGSWATVKVSALKKDAASAGARTIAAALLAHRS